MLTLLSRNVETWLRIRRIPVGERVASGEDRGAGDEHGGGDGRSLKLRRAKRMSKLNQARLV